MKFNKCHPVLYIGFLLVCWAPACLADIDETINLAVQPITDFVSAFVFYEIALFGTAAPVVVLWLVAGAVFFTLYMNFVNVRGFRHAISLVRGDYASPDDKGEVSHFQALATAVSGTVGIGNIGAVAVAVTVGGPGATLWLILAGFLGMSIKFVECTLGVKYRVENADGSVSGGPMYYLELGFKEQGMARLGRFMGIFFAAGILIGAFGIGNMFQSNQAYVQFVNVTGGIEESWFADKGWLFGMGMATVVGSVIIGGIRSIARVTEKVVPFMAVLYCFFAIIVILMNAEAIPQAIINIFAGAFSGEGVSGGALGVMIIGFQRAVFSNEAGIGSAPIAHSAVRTGEPITEGLVSLLEPFIDTVVICTITALVIGTSAVVDPSFAGGREGIAMTSAAFERQISWFPVPLAIAAMLFAFSTMISWSYYGLKGWSYLFGSNLLLDRIYMLIFCCFVALGSTLQLNAILDISDALVFVICVPNIFGLYVLAPLVKRELGHYFERLDAGEFDNIKRPFPNK